MIGTGAAALMVRSGKLNGFELIDCPLILVTLIEAAGVVGRFKGKGVDRNWEPEETLGPPRLFDSKRARPVPPGPSLAELLQHCPQKDEEVMYKNFLFQIQKATALHVQFVHIFRKNE